jgi:pyruvate/2-oxoglutarate dehydrogenase complex dihydrolipoamide dehydrogenase (E3) component
MSTRTPATGAGGATVQDDPHDARLVANVRPSDWSRPPPAARYHLVVIGGGTGGLVTSAIAAALGARVALVERERLGGDCLNTGCVPSKALLAAARAWHGAREAARRFGGPPAGAYGDFPAAMERMRRLRADLSTHDSAARFRDLGVDVFFGEAAFTGPDCVEVEGQTLRFLRAVIATGSRAALPPIPGLAASGALTNETVFSLTRLPSRLVVIGAGPVGCELAQAFARFGSEVTVIEALDRVLPREDAEAAAVVRASLESDGVRFLLATAVDRVERVGDERHLTCEDERSSHRLEADHVLVAAGRAPNVEGLRLDAAGVGLDPAGAVGTDHRLRTSNARVYAIGDVTSRGGFTHAADAQARLVVRNALFWGRGRADDLIVPRCTFTSPELAHVGISSDEVERNAGRVETLTVPFGAVDRARLDDATEGFLRVHLHRGSDRILGATLVGEHAGEIVGQLTQAMRTGTGLGALSDVVAPYPTRAEAVRKVADLWRRGRLGPRLAAGFRWYFRMR